MEYYEIETRSHSGKSRGHNYVWAENEADARAKMKKKKLPVYSIRLLKHDKGIKIPMITNYKYKGTNHQWGNDKCMKCGVVRTEIKQVSEGDDKYKNNIRVYQYSYDGSNWMTKRPDCNYNINRKEQMTNKEQEVKHEHTFSIKDAIKNDKINGNDVKNKAKRNYSDLLKNPKWQKKRLEIMQRDNWICRSCNDAESELHVHHLCYSEEKPWNEPDENLITLCDTCHRAIHYITSCPDIDIEVFVLVLKLYNDLETESINKYLKLQENG